MSVRNRAWLDPLVLLNSGVIHIPSWAPDFMSVLWDASQLVSSNWMDLVPLSENCVTVISRMVLHRWSWLVADLRLCSHGALDRVPPLVGFLLPVSQRSSKTIV